MVRDPGKCHLKELNEGALEEKKPLVQTPVPDFGFRALVDLLPCYLTVQDPQLRIVFANNAFIKDFGEAVGKFCYSVYKNRTEQCEDCPVAKTFTDKVVHTSEQYAKLRDGSTAMLIVYSAPILNPLGNVMAVMEMATNITRVKEGQKELALLGQSLAMLSHDIKNVLEGLQGGAYVVDEAVKDGDMELAGKGWAIVKKNIREITSLTQNILYSAKKRHLKREGLSLDNLAAEVSELFREKANEMGIELQVKANPAIPMVYLEPMSLRRAISNLLWNAMEACDRDNSKEFHQVIVRVDFYDDRNVMLEVEDNGIGMDEETRKNLFQQFFSTKGCGGTGLGLLVVDKIVRENGGRIEVLTSPGKGSTFRLIFGLGLGGS
jgi:signal transduction histidine kinase